MSKRKLHQKGESELAGFFLLLVVCYGLYWWWSSEHGELDGIVKYDDCREIIYLKENSFQAKTKSFTCSLMRTEKGLVMSGECVHIDYAGEGKVCKTAYVYQKKQASVCKNPKFPVLGQDDQCYQ